MSFFGDLWKSFSGGGENPYNAGNKYLDQAKGMYDPYAQQGQNAYNQLNPIYSQYAQDPGAALEQIMGGYQQSPAYQKKFEEMSRAAGNTAAAGGMRGSLSDIQGQADLSRSLMGEDMQQWLQNVLGIQGAGMQGLQGFYNNGYNAIGNQSNILGQQANLGINAQNYENNRGMSMLNNIAKLGGTAAGAMFGTSGLGGMGGFSGDMGNMFGNMPAGGTPSYGKFF